MGINYLYLFGYATGQYFIVPTYKTIYHLYMVCGLLHKKQSLYEVLCLCPPCKPNIIYFHIIWK